jgi:hypothetical protein
MTRASGEESGLARGENVAEILERLSIRQSVQFPKGNGWEDELMTMGREVMSDCNRWYRRLSAPRAKKKPTG